MSVKTKIASFAVAALVLTGGVAATTQQAEAGYKGVGIGVGIAAGALVRCRPREQRLRRPGLRQ